MKIRSLSILAFLGSLVVHALTFSFIFWSNPLSQRVLRPQKADLKPKSMVITVKMSETNPVKKQPTSKENLSEKTPSKMQRKKGLIAPNKRKEPEAETHRKDYSDFLPQARMEEGRPITKNTADREDSFSLDVNGKGLEPEQERKVTYFVNTMQIPISVRRDFKETMSCQLHLKIEGQSLHLFYLTGSPYLRAELFKQFESGEAARNFAEVMEALGEEELFITVNLRSVGSSHDSKTDYRTRLEGRRLRIMITQIYRNDPVGNVSDKITRRQEELNVFYGRELTKSLAFRKIIRDRKYPL